MPTSSKHPTETNPTLEGRHWDELIATLSESLIESSCEFDEWLNQDLAELEQRLSHFSSPRAMKKSLSR